MSRSRRLRLSLLAHRLRTREQLAPRGTREVAADGGARAGLRLVADPPAVLREQEAGPLEVPGREPGGGGRRLAGGALARQRLRDGRGRQR